MTESVSTTTENDNKLIAERRSKLAKLRESGNAFPNESALGRRSCLWTRRDLHVLRTIFSGKKRNHRSRQRTTASSTKSRRIGVDLQQTNTSVVPVIYRHTLNGRRRRIV